MTIVQHPSGIPGGKQRALVVGQSHSCTGHNRHVLGTRFLGQD